MTDHSTSKNETIQVSGVYSEGESGQGRFRYSIKNISAQAVYIFDSPRMPYFLKASDDTLVILYGVHPPKPNVSYYGIEIPLTQGLEPGQTLEDEISLTPLYLKNHYETDRTPTAFGEFKRIQCQVGWGETPILKSDRHKLSIHTLLDWQHLALSDVIPIR